MKAEKILVLKNGDIHPTVETADSVSVDGRIITTSGLIFDPRNVFAVGDTIDEGDYKITSIGADTIDVLDCEGDLHSIPTEKIEWCDMCGDFHVYLDKEDDDEIDEYISGYADAIRDSVEYISNRDQSVIRTILKKMGFNYLSEIDTDEKISEFASKRFEKKPQLTLDDLKEIVGYDFDLV